MPREGILFILVGPSGAGKNTLMKRVQDQLGDLPQLPTATTRAMRPGEKEGREHRFVTHDQFQELIDTDALIEYQPVHMGELYGTPRQTVEDAITAGQDLIADIEFLGAGKIYEAYPNNTVLIFVTPSSLDILARRIRQRGNHSPDEQINRLERAKFEMTFAPRCQHLILNDILEPAAEHLRQIIKSERIRRRGDPAGNPFVLARPFCHAAVAALLVQDGKLLAQSDSLDTHLPIFPIEDKTQAPHEVLQRQIRQALHPAISVEAILDDRFDFVAPHHVAIATIPNNNYLYFYYKCLYPGLDPSELPGWDWHPITALNLPPALDELVSSVPTPQDFV